MKPGMQWPIGIVTILATSVVVNVAFMLVANDDPAFAVEPDYYKRAVAFDTTMHEARLSDALQWSAKVMIEDVAEGRGTLLLELRDRAGVPVLVDSVTADAFFNARANDVVHTVLQRDTRRGAGAYSASIAVSHGGQWEIRIDARRGVDHFVRSVRTEVSVGRKVPKSNPIGDSAKGLER